MEAFSAILERRLQLTIRTLGQAVRTPSGILDITIYSNIGLGRNRRRWKAKKKFCKLSIRMAINSVWTDSVRMALKKIPKLLFVQENLGPSGWPKVPVRTRVPHNPFLTRFWVFEAYK
jgi:hypothetical protein